MEFCKYKRCLSTFSGVTLPGVLGEKNFLKISYNTEIRLSLCLLCNIILFLSLTCLNLTQICFNNSLPDMTSVQFSSVTQSCPTLCDPMNRSTPGLPVHHQLLGFTQIHADMTYIFSKCHIWCMVVQWE